MPVCSDGKRTNPPPAPPESVLWLRRASCRRGSFLHRALPPSRDEIKKDAEKRLIAFRLEDQAFFHFASFHVVLLSPENGYKKGRPPVKVKRPRQPAARHKTGPLALLNFVSNKQPPFKQPPFFVKFLVKFQLGKGIE